jgi:hypothetical protein
VILSEDWAQRRIRHRVQRGNACDDVHVGSSDMKKPRPVRVRAP